MEPEAVVADDTQRILELLAARGAAAEDDRETGLADLVMLLAAQEGRPTEDVDMETAKLAVACVAPLLGIMASPSTELPEFQRAALALCAIHDVDRCNPGWVGAAAQAVLITSDLESSTAGDFAVWTAQGSVVDRMLSKHPAELTLDDARVAVCSAVPFVVWSAAGWDKIGTSMDEFLTSLPANWFLVTGSRQSNERNLALAPLILELLQETGEGTLDDRLLGVAHYSTAMLVAGRGDVALRLLEGGLFEHLVDCLQQNSAPLDWVSTDNVCGRRYCGTALHLMKDLVESCQGSGVDLSSRLVTSGYIDTMTSALLAVEQVGSEKASCWPVVYSLWLLCGVNGEALPEIEARIKNTLGHTLRYMIEHEVKIFSAIGWTTKTFGTQLLAQIWGKEESDAGGQFDLTQADVTELLAWTSELVRPQTTVGNVWSLASKQGRGLKHICISDRNKELALAAPGFISHLLDGLFLVERNPRPETSSAVKAAIQQDFADSILQLALYPRGCEALRADPNVEPAVTALASCALSKEAKDSAERISLALNQLPGAGSRAVAKDQKHVMLSCECRVQQHSWLCWGPGARLTGTHMSVCNRPVVFTGHNSAPQRVADRSWLCNVV